VATVAIGMVVDDTIHMLYRLSVLRGQGLDDRTAVRQALSGSGRALMFTTLTLALSFSIYLFSSLKNVWDFGLLAVLAFLLALACDLVLLPAFILVGRHSS
jgi:predicted RND superfamily exporter protein